MIKTFPLASIEVRCPSCHEKEHAHVKDNKLDITKFPIIDTFEDTNGIKSIRLDCPYCINTFDIILPDVFQSLVNGPTYFIHTYFESIFEFRKFENTDKLFDFLKEFIVRQNLHPQKELHTISLMVEYLNENLESSIIISKLTHG